MHGPYEESQTLCSEAGSLNLELDDDLEEGSNEIYVAEGPERAEALDKLGGKPVVKSPVAGDSRYAHLLANAFISCRIRMNFFSRGKQGIGNSSFSLMMNFLAVEKEAFTVKADW